MRDSTVPAETSPMVRLSRVAKASLSPARTSVVAPIGKSAMAPTVPDTSPLPIAGRNLAPPDIAKDVPPVVAATKTDRGSTQGMRTACSEGRNISPSETSMSSPEGSLKGCSPLGESARRLVISFFMSKGIVTPSSALVGISLPVAGTEGASRGVPLEGSIES